jgi:hypothetical protein
MIFFRRVVLSVATLVLAASSSAYAQAGGGAAGARQLQRQARIQELQQLDIDNRYRVNTDIPPGERALIDYGGYFTFNYLSLDDSVDDNHVLRQYELVGYGRVQFDAANEFFLRGRTGYRDFNDQDSFDGLGDEPIDGDADRAYYKFDLNAYRASYGKDQGDLNVIFKGGRDLAYWANGLVLGQVLDGITVDLNHSLVDIEMLAGVTITRTVDFDPSRPAFDHNTRRGFYGAMATTTIAGQRPYVYGLIQRDYNTHYDELITGAVDTKFDYNSYYVGFGANGNLSDRLRYGVEAAFEFGNTLSNSFEIANGALAPVPQSRDSIAAFALDARLDYIMPDVYNTRLSAEAIYATGDPDRGTTNSTFNGNRPETQDHAFNAFGLVNTGLAFAPAVSNITAFRVGASTFPFSGRAFLRRFQIGTDFFLFLKSRENAPIDETTIAGERYLGVEPDIYLNWQIASDVTLALRYGVFFPSSSAFPIDDTRQFIYAGVTFAF